MLRGLLCVGKVCYPELEHCTGAGPAVARASLRAEAQRVGATTVAAPLRSSLTLFALRWEGLFSRAGCRSSDSARRDRTAIAVFADVSYSDEPTRILLFLAACASAVLAYRRGAQCAVHATELADRLASWPRQSAALVISNRPAEVVQGEDPCGEDPRD